MKKQRRRRHSRRGATVLEMSIILGVFLMMTFGMLDLGWGVYRYHLISHAACQIARRAIVHGSQANVLGHWGPAKIDVTADASGVPVVDGNTDPNYPDGIVPDRNNNKTMIPGCDLSNTTIKVEWIDNSNEPGKRVRVTVSSPYKPFTPFLPQNQIMLIATSTMQIAH